MSDPVPIPGEVFEGIEAVRVSGLSNMLDRDRVAEIAEELEFEETALWIRENPDLYSRGIFRGFRVIEEGER